MGYKSRNHYAQGADVTQEQWDNIFKKENDDGDSSTETRQDIAGETIHSEDDGETEESDSTEVS